MKILITSLIITTLLINNCLANTNKLKIIPIEKKYLSIEKGGEIIAIDAYSDGVGLVIYNNSFDNNPMNKLVFTYGEKAKIEGQSLKDYVLNNGNNSEKELADLLTNNPTQEFVVGDTCNDNNNLTTNDIYIDINGTCIGMLTKNENKCFGDQIGSSFLFNNKSYLVVDDSSIRDYLDNANLLCVSNVTDMSYLFSYNQNISNLDISNWDTSNVIDMNNMFVSSTFNQDISDWDTSNVTNMGNMFSSSTFNQDISDWDTSKVISMYEMFASNYYFNQPIGKWNTSNVITMSSMFLNASSFNQNINNWDTSNVVYMEKMFYNGSFDNSSFNQPLDNWNVSNVQYFKKMFYQSSFNQPLNTWNTISAYDMDSMFYNAKSFNQPLNNWNISNVNNMNYMFYGTTSFNQDIKSWNVSNVKGKSFFRTNSALTLDNSPF